MNKAFISSTFSTPLGFFEVVHDECFIYRAAFTKNAGTPAFTNFAASIAAEIESYFNNSQHCFQLPLKPQGSSYQLKVWNSLLAINSGQTLTYGDLALQLQSSPRAIGQACKRNPLALFIPCHRIIGKTNLGGYMGDPAAITYKEALIAHENSVRPLRTTTDCYISGR